MEDVDSANCFLDCDLLFLLAVPGGAYNKEESSQYKHLQVIVYYIISKVQIYNPSKQIPGIQKSQIIGDGKSQIHPFNFTPEKED